MFDIGPSELILICVVALLIVGPEKLPGAVRTAGLWIGRFRRSFMKVKSEIEQQLNADEIRRQLHNESILKDVEKAKGDMESIVHDTKKKVMDEVEEFDETDLRLDSPSGSKADKDEPAEPSRIEKNAIPRSDRNFMTVEPETPEEKPDGSTPDNGNKPDGGS
ncbi:MAG: Sec-independent protein translocase protein TatB [Pseudohongiellaceae bacterium]